jgi:hypothetical protein
MNDLLLFAGVTSCLVGLLLAVSEVLEKERTHARNHHPSGDPPRSDL